MKPPLAPKEGAGAPALQSLAEVAAAQLVEAFEGSETPPIIANYSGGHVFIDGQFNLAAAVLEAVRINPAVYAELARRLKR